MTDPWEQTRLDFVDAKGGTFMTEQMPAVDSSIARSAANVGDDVARNRTNRIVFTADSSNGRHRTAVPRRKTRRAAAVPGNSPTVT
jgi:hypothetical protein